MNRGLPLASAAEVRAAVKSAKAAQPAWAAANPQQRARVLMKLADLLNRDLNNLADLLARGPLACKRCCAGEPSL